MDYTKLAEEFLEKMYRVNRHRSHKQINESMQGELFVLQYIALHEGDVLPSEISNKMGISSARVAATLNSLEKKGLITRRIDTSDRRRILVELTLNGKEEAEKHFQMILKNVAEMLSALGERDAKEYVRIIGRLSEITSKYHE
ncbi:MarR family winged helix-turn-helix transcriptional regulator [Desulfitobacterium hafniense]|uniref:HTH marR-type domain-containing protein n=1 Tax=Desulfitobacterium hafniense (strain Y51) TaxID=138119 RepID=Q24QU0_DESHY|nr:MarR family transcriptional regulator [Desulfitobacterium hafniense]BAE85602.1 hypothetical protein DSY3813 [Desulfitobacterium hafniense Y51]